MNLYVLTSQLSTENAIILNRLIEEDSIDLKGIYFSKKTGGDKGLKFKIKRLLSYGVGNLFKIYLQKKKRFTLIEQEQSVTSELQKCQEALENSGIDQYRGDSFKDFLGQATEDQESLILLIYFNRIIAKKFIREDQAIINLHPGKLPDFRGAQPIFWALNDNQKEINTTVHRVDAGIDTGPVYESFSFENTDDSIHSNLLKSSLVLRDKLPALLQRISNGEVIATPQPSSDIYYTRPNANEIKSFLAANKRYY